MGKIVLRVNVRLKGETEFDRESYDKIINDEYDGDVKKYINEAKKDFKRACKSDLGFEEDDVNITKFELEFIDDEVADER